MEVGFLRAPSFSAPRVTDVISDIKTSHWRQARHCEGSSEASPSAAFAMRSVLHSSAGKESASNAAGPGSIPGLGRSLGERIGYPLRYSGEESDMTE